MVRTVAWHWKVPGSIPGEDIGIFNFSGANRPACFENGFIIKKTFFLKITEVSPQIEVSRYKQICTYIGRYEHICTDIGLIQINMGGYLQHMTRYEQFIKHD